MRTLRSAPRRRGRLIGWQRDVLLALVVLLAALPFWLPLSDQSRAGLLVSWCVPIAIVGVLYGATGGFIAATIATALAGIWGTTQGDGGGWVGFLVRASVFFSLGFGLGWFVGRARDRE